MDSEVRYVVAGFWNNSWKKSKKNQLKSVRLSLLISGAEDRFHLF